MQIITFENVLDQIVNNRNISRKEKHVSIHKFLRENSGKGKQPLPDEIAIIEKLKTIKKIYSEKDKAEKQLADTNKLLQ